MLDNQAAQNFFKHTHELWIQPEIERRRSEGILPDNFQIRECLIRLPQDKPPIVEFNDEFGWEMEFPELAPGVKMEPGKVINRDDLIDLGRILPPTVDEKRVAFVYLYWDGFSYRSVFSFSPNRPDFDPEKDDFQLGGAIAQHLRLKMIEMTIRWAASVKPQLRQIGLWPVTSLLMYPMPKIVERIGNGHLEEARTILIEYCNPEFIEQRLVETWKPIQVFNDRMDVFYEALFAHRNKKFHATVYTLIPQVEGVITDWLYPIIKPSKSMNKWSANERIKQFRDMVDSITQLEYVWREALNAVSEFIREGPPLQRFERWLDAVDTSFPGRHPLAHGRYVREMFNEENSIKLFLLLDTICQFMMFYEVRKLGKNLGQNGAEDA